MAEVLLFLAFAAAITGVLGLVGGWYGLARRYPAGTVSTRNCRSVGLLAMGLSSYPGASICVTAKGILFRAGWFYRLMHPPFLLPWEVVEQRGFGVSACWIRVQDRSILVLGRAARWLLESNHLQGQRPSGSD